MIHEYSWFDEDFLNVFKWMINFMFIWGPGSFVAFYKCMFDTQKSFLWPYEFLVSDWFTVDCYLIGSQRAILSTNVEPNLSEDVR